MFSYILTVDPATDNDQLVEIKAGSPQNAVAIARGRGELSLNQPIVVKRNVSSQYAPVIHRAEPTDETKLQIELLTLVAESKIHQDTTTAIAWGFIAGLFYLAIIVLVLGGLLSIVMSFFG